MTADQSPLFPRASTDRLRTVLAARLPADPKWVAWVDGVVGELAGCVVEDPRLAQIRALHVETMRDEDYPQIDTLCRTCQEYWPCATVRVLGAPPVAATPPQGIDRDTLNRVLEDFSLLGLNEKSADRILALVRPVEGVVITRREAQTALGWYADAFVTETGPARYDRDLAEKLGEAR